MLRSPFPRRALDVVRAVAASLGVAIVLAVAYLAYDIALSRGAVRYDGAVGSSAGLGVA